MGYPEVDWGARPAPALSRPLPPTLRVAAWWSIVLGPPLILVGGLSVFASLWVFLRYDVCESDLICEVLRGALGAVFLVYGLPALTLGVVGLVAGIGMRRGRRRAARVATWVFGPIAVLSALGVMYHFYRLQVPATSGYLLLAVLFGVPAFLPLTRSAREALAGR